VVDVGIAGDWKRKSRQRKMAGSMWVGEALMRSEQVISDQEKFAKTQSLRKAFFIHISSCIKLITKSTCISGRNHYNDSHWTRDYGSQHRRSNLLVLSVVV